MFTRRVCSRIAIPLLFGTTIAAGAVAQPAPPNADAMRGGIEYLNGGIGKGQADQMRELGPRFPVRMTFSRHNSSQGTDEFVADVRLRVTDSAGKTVVDLASQGPIFLLRVPAGSYSVEAQHNGEVKTHRFEVAPGRHDNLAFSWAG